LNWKSHIGELASRLNKACFTIRSIKPFMSLDVLRSTYFSYVQSIITYGIIFWGNSSHSEEMFKIQTRIIRIIMNSSKNTSCRQLFKELHILPIQLHILPIQLHILPFQLHTLPIQSQYIFSIILFVIKNKDQLLFKSQVHKNKYKANFQFIPTFSKLGNIPKGCLLLRS